ncbi:D-gamma-glutamyl-meso-diaminopimelic acid endopeptidase CwlS precursor [compost metagenome]
MAVFPEAYVEYVAKLLGRPAPTVLASARRSGETRAAANAGAAATERHTVRRGETLWRIAQDYDTTPAAIRRANKLASSTILAGQRLLIP